MAPTKDELEQRVVELEQENAKLRDAAAASGDGHIATGLAGARKPERPKDDQGNPILSAGEKTDLEQHGVTISPFTGETLDAITEGVETLNPDAHRRAVDAQKKRRAAERRDDTPPPAAGRGDQ